MYLHMKTKHSNIRDLFKAGKLQPAYKIILKNKYSDLDYPWVIGTLCFLGLFDEALLLSKRLKIKCSIAQFFILITAIRLKKLDHIKIGFDELKKFKSLDHKNHFYFYQALSFYAYFQSRYKISLYFLEKSRESLLFHDESYWKVMAIDLLGHNYIQMGDIHKGISYLKEASEIASLIKNDAFKKALSTSQLLYEAQFSTNPISLIKKIETKCKSIGKNDNYSENALRLTLAHLYMLIGQMNQAYKILIKTQHSIYAYAIPRHIAWWNFEMAYLYSHYQKNDMTFFHLDEAVKFIDQYSDKKMHLKILGLKSDVLKADGKSELRIELSKTIESLTNKLGDPLSHSHLNRRNENFTSLTQDPLNHFFNQLESNKIEDTLGKMVDLKYYGFLRKKLSIKANETAILFGVFPKGILILHQDWIKEVPNGVGELLKTALEILCQGRSISKEELVQTIWGYQYDPIRHDTLVYHLIHRLRKSLGALSTYLTGDNHCYKFNHSVKLLRLKIGSNYQFTQSITNDQSIHQNPKLIKSSWNLRQIKALSIMKQGEFYSVSQYALVFKVSKISALRDLTELLNQGHIHRIGSARSTQYGILDEDSLKNFRLKGIEHA